MERLQFCFSNPAYCPDLEVISEPFRGGGIFRKWQQTSDFKGHDFLTIALISQVVGYFLYVFDIQEAGMDIRVTYK